MGGGPGTYFAPHGLAHYNFLVGGIRDCYRKKYVKKSFVRNCFDDVEHGDKVFETVCRVTCGQSPQPVNLYI